MPLGPDVGESWYGLALPHALSRSVRDSAALLDASAGADLGAPYASPPAPAPPAGFAGEVRRDPGRLRIAFSERSQLGHHTHADCSAALRDAMALCASLGHEVVEAEPQLDRAGLRLAYLTLVAVGAASSVEQTRALTGRTARAALFEPATWFLAQVGRSLSALQVERARTLIFSTTRELARFLQQYDVFASSTMAYPPVRVAELALGRFERLGLGVMRVAPSAPLLQRALAELADSALERTANTMLFNMTGQPAMSVPLAWNAEGLPIGTQFAGRFGDEATLLRLAGQLEAARPWWDKRPPL
jgi:amidase